MNLSDETRAELGKRIDAARERARLTLKELARRAECTERTVRNAIQGESVRPRNLIAICQAANVDLPDELGSGPTPDSFGYSSRNDVAQYEGFFAAYYRNLMGGDTLFCSVLHMTWDDTRNVVAAEQYTRLKQDGKTPYDYTMRGHLYCNDDAGTRASPFQRQRRPRA